MRGCRLDGRQAAGAPQSSWTVGFGLQEKIFRILGRGYETGRHLCVRLPRGSVTFYTKSASDGSCNVCF